MATILAAAPAAGERGLPRSASSCCSPPARSSRCAGAKAFDRGSLRRRVRLRLRPRLADRRDRRRLADLLPARGRLPRPGRARRHPARGRPQRDRGRGAGRSRRCDSAGSTTRPPPTSARSRAARPPNVVAERCQVVLEARSLDDARAGEVVSAMVDALTEAASDAECDVETAVERLFRGYRLAAHGAGRGDRRRGAAARSASSRPTSPPAAAATPTP